MTPFETLIASCGTTQNAFENEEKIQSMRHLSRATNEKHVASAKLARTLHGPRSPV